MKLILLPGMDGTGELFSGFVSALPERFDPTRMQYPKERAVSWPKFEYVLRAVCPNEPYILIAESFSTPLAVRHAASNPPNLKGIVLVAGFIRSPWRGWRRGLALLAAPIVFRVPLTDFAVRRWLAGEDATDSLVAAVKAAIASVEPGVLSARLRLILKCDVRERASHIKVPMLYIRGTRDRLVSSGCLEELRSMSPPTEVIALDAPHLILQSRPSEAAAAVMEFMEHCAGDLRV